MYITTVIPISKVIGKEHFSYFSSAFLAPGHIVTVSIRRRTVQALVVETREASGAKAELKEANFFLKRIRTKKSFQFFDPPFISAISELCKYFVAGTGEILTELTPAFALRQIEEFSNPISAAETPNGNENSSTLRLQTLAIQAPFSERLLAYRNIIRETFARGKSSYLVIPTLGDLERVLPVLSRGVEPYVFSFHGALPQKETMKTWKSALALPHPILAVGTAHFLSLPRRDFGAYIVECEHRRGYKGIRRPYLDFRIVVERLAKARGAEFILGDTLLSVDTRHRLELGEFSQGGSFRQHIELPVVPEIVDSRGRKKQAERTHSCEEGLFSSEARTLIALASGRGERFFFFAIRKGIASLTICGDCGAILSCPDCVAPLVLKQAGVRDGIEFSSERPRAFICLRCDFKTSASLACQICKSWRLATLGFGVERIALALKELFPNRPILSLSSDTARTPREAQKIRELFEITPGSLLVGTEMALYFLRKPVDNIVVVSLDTLFAVPDYRMNERIFALVAGLAERTDANGRFLIQTRRPQEKIWAEIKILRSASFYRSEIRERALFGYPPATVLVKIRWQGPRAKKLVTEKHLQKILDPYEPVFISSQNNKKSDTEKVITLLRIPRTMWPPPPLEKSASSVNPAQPNYSLLSALLRGLPREFVIDVQPEDLLA